MRKQFPKIMKKPSCYLIDTTVKKKTQSEMNVFENDHKVKASL